MKMLDTVNVQPIKLTLTVSVVATVSQTGLKPDEVMKYRDAADRRRETIRYAARVAAAEVKLREAAREWEDAVSTLFLDTGDTAVEALVNL